MKIHWACFVRATFYLPVTAWYQVKYAKINGNWCNCMNNSWSFTWKSALTSLLCGPKIVCPISFMNNPCYNIKNVRAIGEYLELGKSSLKWERRSSYFITVLKRLGSGSRFIVFFLSHNYVNVGDGNISSSEDKPEKDYSQCLILTLCGLMSEFRGQIKPLHDWLWLAGHNIGRGRTSSCPFYLTFFLKYT